MSDEDTVSIPRRFNGPPDTGHGGYSCGVAGVLVDGPAAEVRLRRPPPLDAPFEIDRSSPEQVRLLHGEESVAEARPTELVLELPEPVSPEVAARSELSPDDLADHLYPTCFGCGPDRSPDDGLRLFAGAIEGRRGEVACPLVFPDSVADARGWISDEVVWGALDCPSAFAFGFGDSVPDEERAAPALTGTITAAVEAPLRAGEEYVIQGWTIGREGRKLFSGSAILTGDGEPMAWCRVIWVILRDA